MQNTESTAPQGFFKILGEAESGLIDYGITPLWASLFRGLVALLVAWPIAVAICLWGFAKSFWKPSDAGLINDLAGWVFGLVIFTAILAVCAPLAAVVGRLRGVRLTP